MKIFGQINIINLHYISEVELDNKLVFDIYGNAVRTLLTFILQLFTLLANLKEFNVSL